jgi:glycosyltransferase involved in cell wall biosynthesis
VQHPERARQLGARAARAARERFAWDRVIVELLAAYEAIRGRRSG